LFSRFCKFISNLYRRFIDDDVLALGAQMAYYLVLSFFPFLVFLIALISYSPVSSRQVLEGLLGILPEEAYVLVRDTLEEIGGRKNGGLASISGVLSLWFASNGIGAIITGLNKAYDERERRSFIRVKLISLFFTLLLSIAIVFSFTLLVFGGVIKRRLIDGMSLTPFYQGLWDIGRYIFIASVILLIFIILYRYTPSRRMGRREPVQGHP
jgi:membrane protein